MSPQNRPARQSRPPPRACSGSAGACPPGPHQTCLVFQAQIGSAAGALVAAEALFGCELARAILVHADFGVNVEILEIEVDFVENAVESVAQHVSSGDL